ncbi:MAG TPA: GGDEF domain-containing protein, partial [Duganella sp.]
MFALDEELARWEAALPETSGARRLPLLVALAWHLRQRAPARARALSADIVPLLETLPPGAALLARGRLLLIAAEADWLNGQLDTAQYQAEQALLLFEQVSGAPVSTNPTDAGGA